MHTVELYRKVRLACRDGMSERAAARHFGISRESVKKMLRFSVPPGYRRTAPVRRPKLDGFTEIIDRWLKEDLKQLRKQPPSPNTMLLPCARRVSSISAVAADQWAGSSATSCNEARMRSNASRSLIAARSLDRARPARTPPARMLFGVQP